MDKLLNYPPETVSVFFSPILQKQSTLLTHQCRTQLHTWDRHTQYMLPDMRWSDECNHACVPIRFNMVTHPIAELVCECVPAAQRCSTPTFLCYAELDKLPHGDLCHVFDWMKAYLDSLQNCTFMVPSKRTIFSLSRDASKIVPNPEMQAPLLVSRKAPSLAL